ncbi:serine O-acetyltransferase [Kocuria turfanensis]|uniref:Serine acetyltransferase n=1 Tax=Kocuria turfanensis TaxID=388357 RepID=A0A512IG55_9MICC|nr:hypothetical protein [Kocuria turfanensis]GEO96684.1 hypothetical protein KTU01_28070 [Kocuria turfanensis]
MAAPRFAHRLWSTRWGRPAARAIATAAAKAIGITIHPGAVIGHRLFIDHGSEVVIGQTSVIGDDVTIYQGASFVGDGFPGRRHAVVGNGVLIGSGAKVGAGAVVTSTSPPEPVGAAGGARRCVHGGRFTINGRWP